MRVRLAEEKDIAKICDLLAQVDLVHHNGRPDIFKVGTKHTNLQIKEMLNDSIKPILVCVDNKDFVLGYCFAIFKEIINDSVLQNVKTLYIDDLCVDEKIRRQGVGKTLLDYAVEFAKLNGCHNVTLNVWKCNPQAIKFYQACGFLPQKIVMEKIL